MHVACCQSWECFVMTLCDSVTDHKVTIVYHIMHYSDICSDTPRTVLPDKLNYQQHLCNVLSFPWLRVDSKRWKNRKIFFFFLQAACNEDSSLFQLVHFNRSHKNVTVLGCALNGYTILFGNLTFERKDGVSTLILIECSNNCIYYQPFCPQKGHCFLLPLLLIPLTVQ